MIKLKQEVPPALQRGPTTRPRRAQPADNVLLDQLLATLPCGVGILDSQFRFVRVSDALAHIDGVCVSAHMGRTVDGVLGELQWRSIRPYCIAAAEGRTTIDVDLTSIMAPGRGSVKFVGSFFPIRGCGSSAVIGIAISDKAAALQAESERTAMLAAVDEACEQRRRYLAEMLAALTDNKLRLCRHPAQLPAALAPISPPIDLSGQSLCEFRHKVLGAAAGLGLEPDRAGDFVMAVGEALDNVLVHAGRGSAQVFGDSDSGVLQVRVVDEGPGIAEKDLHRAALERGYTTAGSFGHGFYMMLNTCDRLWLCTSPGGTTLVLEQERLAPTPSWLTPR